MDYFGTPSERVGSIPEIAACGDEARTVDWIRPGRAIPQPFSQGTHPLPTPLGKDYRTPFPVDFRQCLGADAAFVGAVERFDFSFTGGGLFVVFFGFICLYLALLALVQIE